MTQRIQMWPGHQSLEGDPCSGRLYDAVNQLLIATAEKMVWKSEE